MTQKEWTIMVYMAGDNNLSVDMAYAMQQIKEVAGKSPESPNIFVYYDGNSRAIPTLYCDFSDPLRPTYVSSRNAPDKLMKVPDKYNENAASEESVINFVDWCVNKVEVRNGDEVTRGRRANRYALIFSGHSLGFQDIGLFKDETTGKSMKMYDLYYALQRVVSTESQLKKDLRGLDIEPDERKRDTTVLLGQKLDILGFDSCVMGMLEVGYQFGYVAKTMIASEGSVPNAGWTYAKLLGSLACTDESVDASEKVAERFVRGFIEGQDSYTIGGVSVDMAAWNMKKLRDVARAFDDLSQALLEAFDEPGGVIYRQMQRVILQVHWQAQSYMFDQNVDLGDFCELLDEECGRVVEELGGDNVGFFGRVQKLCRKVVEALRDAVIVSGFSGGTYQYSNGMSIFFPWTRAAYEASKKNYESLFFAKDGRDRRLYWTGFLRRYLHDVSYRRAAEPTPEAPAGTKYRYDSGLPFDTGIMSTNGDGETKIAGTEGSKIAGHQGSKIAGQQGSKIAGQQGSKIAGQQGSKIAGHAGSKIAGQAGSKIAGQAGSKIAGHQGSKIAGNQGSKIAGNQGSKIAGDEGSKIAGHEGSKLANGGSESAFFDNLKLFKNVESRWNISGFTKRADGDES